MNKEQFYHFLENDADLSTSQPSPGDVMDLWDKLLKEYDDLAAEMVRRNKAGNGFNFFHFMIDLEGGPCVYKRLSGCGSGTEYLAVTPWGDLYPCHQFVGNEKFLMGNVHDGVVNTGLQEEFKCCNVYAKENTIKFTYI